METRTILGDLHLGRLQLRLARNALDSSAPPTWYEMYGRDIVWELVLLGVKEKPRRSLSALQISLDYHSIKGRSARQQTVSSGEDGGSIIASSRSMHDLREQVAEGEAIGRQSMAEAMPATDIPAILIDRATSPTKSSSSASIQEEGDNHNHTDDAAIAVKNVSEVGFKEDFWDKLGRVVMSAEDVYALRSCRAILAGFGQNMDSTSSYKAALSLVVLQRYTDSLPRYTSGTKVSFLVDGKIFSLLTIRFFLGESQLTAAEVDTARHFYRYSMATMGWRGLNVFGVGGGFLVDSARPDADRKTVLEYLGMEADPEALLIFNLNEHRLFRPNFFVAIDREHKALVLAVRGTMSLRDTLTDLVCEYAPFKTLLRQTFPISNQNNSEIRGDKVEASLEDLPKGPDGLVHTGMMSAARWFWDNLGRQLLRWVQEYQLEQLIFTGHSLGAGTAALTCMITLEWLWEDPATRWPTYKSSQEDGASLKPVRIHSYNYGTPCVVSPQLAQRYTSFLDSFIYGDDLVPRLSYGSAADLMLMLTTASEHLSTWHLMTRSDLNEDVVKALDKCANKLRINDALHPKLVQPGRVHHIMKVLEEAGDATEKMTKKWVDTLEPTDQRFHRIELRSANFVHHLPHKYKQALDEVYQELLRREEEIDNNSNK